MRHIGGEISSGEAEVLIALGSNLGDRQWHISTAITLIHERCGPLSDRADIYETLPIGGIADQLFLNTAVCCRTDLLPLALLSELQKIEVELKRQRCVRWANRTIDLDILLWKNRAGDAIIINNPNLEIPHPRLLCRDFVLIPAAQIAPEWIHPITGQSLDCELKKRRVN